MTALLPVLTAGVFSLAGGLALVTIGRSIVAAMRDTLK